MSKVFYPFFTLLLAFCLFGENALFGQETFLFSGKLMIDSKPVDNASVLVFLDGKTVGNAATNKVGSFLVNLQFQKVYILQFKHSKYPLMKVLVSTKTDKPDGANFKSKVTVFTLESNKSSTDDPTKSDVVAGFQIDKNGFFIENPAILSLQIDKNEQLQNQNNSNIEKIKRNIDGKIVEMPKDIQPELKLKYESVNAQIDSLLNQAYLQYGLIIQSGRLKSEDIVNNTFINLPSELKVKSESALKNDDILISELKKLAIDEKSFLSNENIKAIKRKISGFTKQSSLSRKDSLAYLQTLVQFKEEILKSARLQLEIDKLNSRSKADSVALQQRQTAIYLAEQEIKEAKDKIQIQQLEIKQINTMLLFAGSGLVFFIILSLVVYKSFRDKKHTNIILEKNNLEIANKNKKIIDSIRYAQTIQQAILPIKSTIDKHFESFIIFQPKDIVSGDFYWFDHFDYERKSVFAVVDCTGHGVPGAFMSMIGNRLLIEAVKEKGITNPVDILEEIDSSLRIALMQEETANNDGMDMCVCCIEYLSDTQCKVDFAGAKRPLFYSDGENELNVIKGTVRGLGGKKRIREKAIKPFEGHTMMLHKGDMIYLTSDGFFDLQSPNRKKFGKNSFIELVSNCYTLDLNDQKESIMDALHLHKGSEYQIDDITILGIRL